MSQPKSQYQTYTTDWGKVKAWAQGQKIPEAAVNNVQALDQSRLQSGYYPMSDAERTRAILAAAGMNYNTALPTDNPGASDVVGNTIRNVQGIATGLMPTRLVSNIWDTLKTTVNDIEHPQKSGGIGKILENTAVSWLPGAYDLGQVIQAHGLMKGVEDLAKQPVTSLLDVMPFLSGANAAVGALAATGSAEDAIAAGTKAVAPKAGLNMPDTGAATTSLGKALSTRLGMDPRAVTKLGAVRMMGKGVGSITLGSKVSGELPAVAGKEAIRVPTLAERASLRAQAMGVGKTLSTAAHTLGSLKAKYTQDYRQVTKDLRKAVSDLTPDIKDDSGSVVKEGEYGEFNRVMHSGKSAEDILNSPDVSAKVKQAVKAYIPWEEWHKKYMIAGGKAIPLTITEMDGSTHTFLYDASTYNELTPFRVRAEKAEKAATAATAEADAIASQQLQRNDAYTPIRQNLMQIKQNLTSTMGVTQSFVRKSFTDLLGSIIGRDGLLDQMDSAYRAKDWGLYARIAKNARRRLESPKFAGDTSPNIVHLKASLEAAYQHGVMSRDLQKAYLKAYNKKAMDAERTASEAQATFMREVQKRPPAEYRDLVAKLYYKNLLASDKAEALLEAGANKLVKKYGFSKQAADKLRRSNPQRLFEIINNAADGMFNDPFLPQMTPRDNIAFRQDALKEVASLRARGNPPMWVPTLSVRQAESSALHDDHVYIAPDRYPQESSSWAKAMDMSRTVNDVMLGVNRATKEAMSKDGGVEFAHSIILPMLKAKSTLLDAVYRDEFAQRRLFGETAFEPGAITDSMIGNHLGMASYNAEELYLHTGLRPEDLGLDPNETYYLPKAFKNQLGKLVGDQFPLHGAWDTSTAVFKYSILGLSPRYTAHILFGGGMMLALRIDPRSFLMIRDAAKMVNQYHHGNLEDTKTADIFQGATQRGSPEQDFHMAAGRKAFSLVLEEWLSRRGINPKLAKGVDIAKAGADINFRFTNYISDMQKTLAYLDGMKSAKGRKYFDDPITGERKEMTQERMHWEAMQAAERVMGNLQAMTPLERSVARKIMPFYGWTKHVLKYILTYPTDHPWRVMFLSTLATQNSDNFASGLDERMQLLLFLGQPDTNGNVSAVDVRAIDPFRDVANYATLTGWISGLNPIITAPFTAIDPSIIYGGNTLYPNVTYSQMYGTNVAQPSGGLLTAAEQEIPEIGALDQALGLSAQARAIKKQGGTAQLKDLLSSLGFPWTVQKLNLQQISAKHEIDRYNQAKTDAATAWSSGDFSTLNKYPGTVPDPLGTGYEISPKELQKQYQQALKKSGGLPPSEVTPNLPTAPL